MDKYEELASEIIDDVCERVEEQHPEIKLHTKETKEAGIDDPAVITGELYYSLERGIADSIKDFVKDIVKGVKQNSGNFVKDKKGNVLLDQHDLPVTKKEMEEVEE